MVACTVRWKAKPFKASSTVYVVFFFCILTSDTHKHSSTLKPYIKWLSVKINDLMQHCISCQRHSREPL